MIINLEPSLYRKFKWKSKQGKPMLYIAQEGTLRYPAGSTTVLEAIVRYAISMGIQTQLLKCVAKK